VNQQFHYRTKYTRETNNSRSNGAHPPDSENDLAQALNILGIDNKTDAATAKRAYRKRALQVHPDVSALPRSEADRRFKELNRAYEYLKEVKGWD
jgi:DnaJ-class molecular chaperone